MIIGILLGALGAAVLHAVYALLRNDWPEQYSSVRTIFEATRRKGPFHYTLIRAFPVYLTCLLVGATTHKLEQSALLAILLTSAIHLATTNLRALWIVTAGRRDIPNRSGLVVYHIGAIGIVAGAAFVANLTYERLLWLTPTPVVLLDSLWTASFAAVAAVGLLEVLRNAPLETEDKLIRARKDVGNPLWERISVLARQHDCDPEFITAIVAAEVAQRPRWARKMERVTAKFRGGRGSYGVAQVTSDTSLGDEQSIVQLCETFSGYFPFQARGGGRNPEFIKAHLEVKHNSSPALLDDIIEMYHRLVPYTRHASDSKARDGRSTIEVLNVKRIGQEILLTGTAVADPTSFFVLSDLPSHLAHPRLKEPTAFRTAWEYRLPISTECVYLVVSPDGWPESIKLDEMEGVVKLIIDDCLY